MVEVRELEVFLAAAEQENFSVAARELHLTQPAVSFQIQALEHRLNVQLFNRIGRRISLTEAGRMLMPLARELIDLASRIEETMDIQQGRVKGHIVIGCSTSPGQYILPHLIGVFREHYPEVVFSVELMDGEAVEEKLLTKQLHLGVLNQCSKQKDLQCRPFFTDELALIAPVQHPWAEHRSIAPQDLKRADWILRERGACTRRLVEAALEEHGVDSHELHVSMELGSPEAIEAAVEAGHGVSFVSRITVHRALEMGRIRQISVEGMVIQRQLYIAHYPSRTSTRAESRFYDFIGSCDGQRAIHSRMEQVLSSETLTATAIS